MEQIPYSNGGEEQARETLVPLNEDPVIKEGSTAFIDAMERLAEATVAGNSSEAEKWSSEQQREQEIVRERLSEIYSQTTDPHIREELSKITKSKPSLNRWMVEHFGNGDAGEDVPRHFS